MKKTWLMLISAFLAFAAVPAGYEHWTREQFGAHEKELH